MARDGAPAKGKYQRRPPAPAVQAERKEWGAEYGPKVGGGITAEIAAYDATGAVPEYAVAAMQAVRTREAE